MSDSGRAALAREFDAVSEAHVEYASDADAGALARSGSVAVFLPGAFYAIREEQAPPIAAFRKHGVHMAVATDWNPGSSPLGSVLLAMNIACTLFRLPPADALAGTTRSVARALGVSDRRPLPAGQRADFAHWDVPSAAERCHGIYTSHVPAARVEV